MAATDDFPILVTGATGFLGGELVRTLSADGVSPDRLRCLVRDPALAARRGLPAAAVRVGDVTRPETLEAAARDVALVYHVAGAVKASRNAAFTAVNATGTQHLLAALDRVAAPDCRVVLVSSLAAAGPSVDGAGTDAPPEQCRPVSAYGESKRQGELAVRRSGRRHLIVRPPVIYGSGDAATRLLFRQACGPLCAVPARPRPLSVVHVRDVASLLLAAARPWDDATAGACLPVDGPDRSDTHALVRAIAAACGRKARLLPLPLSLAAAAAAVVDALAMMTGRSWFFSGDKVKELKAPGWVADAGRARRLLGWQPRTQLASGLREVARAEGFAADGASAAG